MHFDGDTDNTQLALYLQALEPRPAVRFQLWLYNYERADQPIAKGRAIVIATFADCRFLVVSDALAITQMTLS